MKLHWNLCLSKAAAENMYVLKAVFCAKAGEVMKAMKKECHTLQRQTAFPVHAEA